MDQQKTLPSISALLPQGVPQTELHRHLDVSIRAGTLLNILKREGVEPASTGLDAFQKRLILREPMTDLPSVLNLFQTFQKAFVRAEDCAQIAFEVAEDCWNEGTERVELRWSPTFVSEFTGIPWEEALEGFVDGLARAHQKYPKLQAGLIGIVSRDYGFDAAKKTVRFVLDHARDFVGLDLAGNETAWPTYQFEEAFAPARKAGFPTTVHAGEATGPEEMWDAIQKLGARRIGHGIACFKDPALMRELQYRDIALEVCPTSNWLTQCTRTVEEHPVVSILRSGVPVTINTDDPGVFGVTLHSEIELCRTHLGMTDSEVQQVLKTAARASFLAP